MNSTHLLNGAALLVALGLALAAVAGAAGRERALAGAAVAGAAATVTDASGQPVPVRAWTRIASVSLTADAALVDCCEPERVAAFSSFTTGPGAFRLGAKPRLHGLDDLEAVLALRPDLVLVAEVGAVAERVARLRAAGITVFALAPMTGLEGYCQDLERVAAVLGAPDRGRRAATAHRRRLAAVAAGLPPGAVRPRAIYLAPIAGMLFGGTTGTSYHEVLIAGGCSDAAAARFSGWPQYTVEQILALAPAVVVTKAGCAAELARLPGLDALFAGGARVVEIDGDVLEHPGPPVVEAAEALFAAVHGGPASGTGRPAGGAQ
jgi:iron complex transport system substrate-binding protein